MQPPFARKGHSDSFDDSLMGPMAPHTSSSLKEPPALILTMSTEDTSELQNEEVGKQNLPLPVYPVCCGSVASLVLESLGTCQTKDNLERSWQERKRHGKHPLRVIVS